MRRILALLIAVVGVAAWGALLGVIWEALAPRVTLVIAGDGRPYPQGYQPGGYMTADGIAALLCLGAGVIVGLAAVWIARRAVAPAYSIPVALGASLALGVVGAVALMWTGQRLGYIDLDAVVAAGAVGDTITAPLRLRMSGVLVLWPVASALVVFIAALGDWWRGRGPEHIDA
jgi:hypothetical protein